MKISFDFDGCIGDLGAVQDYCRLLLAEGRFEVYIITRRYRAEHPMSSALNEAAPVRALAEALGVDQDRVVFTDREYKVDTLNQLGIDVHLDDDVVEGMYIRQTGRGCRFVCTDSTQNPDLRNWRAMLDEMLGLPPLRAPW